MTLRLRPAGSGDASFLVEMVDLSVERANSARRLHRSAGLIVLASDAAADTMVRSLRRDPPTTRATSLSGGDGGRA